MAPAAALHPVAPVAGAPIRRIGPRLTLTQMLIGYAAVMAVAAAIVFFMAF